MYWTVVGKCSGECCRLMTLSVSPEKIAILATHGHRDAKFVVNNFIPVRRSFVDAVTGLRLTRGETKPSVQYRCLQWDGKTKRCAAYDSRPEFCVRHGEDYRCLVSSCSLRVTATTIEHLRMEGEGGLTGSLTEGRDSGYSHE